jgi:SAM-dependent methyltransferase
LVEHFYPDTLPAAIAEWRRVLKFGGKLVIVTPDCGSVFKDYAVGKFDSIESVWQQVYGRIYHYDGASERHHIAFDWHQLAKMVGIVKWQGVVMINSGGWSRATPFNFNAPPVELVPFMDKHISRGAYQLGIVLTK